MEELLSITIKVLEKFNSLNLTFNLEKCVFFSQKLEIFGEIFDLKNQTTVISEKKRGNFLSWTRPNTKKRFLSYQGLISWMRSYGTNIAEDLKRLQPNEDTGTK
jgi:hypothetical protein